MTILLSKTIEAVTIVHVDDPDVQPDHAGEEGWILKEKAKISPGATVVAVGPLSKRQLMRTTTREDRGDLVYDTMVYGIRKVGSWRDVGGIQKLVMENATEESAEEFLEAMEPLPVAALWRFISALTGGWDPMAPTEPDTSDPGDPKKKPGPGTDGP